MSYATPGYAPPAYSQQTPGQPITFTNVTQPVILVQPQRYGTIPTMVVCPHCQNQVNLNINMFIVESSQEQFSQLDV
jgi:hypothetical protein